MLKHTQGLKLKRETIRVMAAASLVNAKGAGQTRTCAGCTPTDTADCNPPSEFCTGGGGGGGGGGESLHVSCDVLCSTL